jgi:hypothetical protein
MLTHTQVGQLIAKAWLDPKFAHDLTNNHADTVRKFLNLDPSVAVVPIPVPPKPADLTQQQLQDVVDGKSHMAMAPYSC